MLPTACPTADPTATPPAVAAICLKRLGCCGAVGAAAGGGGGGGVRAGIVGRRVGPDALENKNILTFTPKGS